jgi:hypothetical protein
MLAEGVEGLPVMRAIALVGAHEPDQAWDLARQWVPDRTVNGRP